MLGYVGMSSGASWGIVEAVFRWFGVDSGRVRQNECVTDVTEMCYICDMADLNLRNIHPGLISKLKADAATNGSTLRDHCVCLLTGQASPEPPTQAIPDRRNLKDVPKRSRPTAYAGATRAPALTTAAQVVSAVPGVHLASQLPQPAAYQRPSHAANCTCFTCRPPQ
jgi:hypothetical protein